jgi:hypothetical protein
MTLDEAIEHCKEKATCYNECGKEHWLLRRWLLELKEFRKRKKISSLIKVINIWRYDKNKFYDIAILKHKDSGKYSFVNLTKGHICPCLFDTYEDAYKELLDKQSKGELHIEP